MQAYKYDIQQQSQSQTQRWRQRISSITKIERNQIKKRIQTVQWKQASLAAFLVYTVFAVDFMTHTSEGSISMFYLKLLVVLFMIGQFMIKWSPKFSVTRKISQLTSVITKIYIPTSIRKLIYSQFSDTYGVITKDMVKPFSSYQNFNEFFTRTVKPRYLNPNPNLVLSPADSKVLSIAQIKSNDCLLVKKINYKLGHFITGEPTYQIDSDEMNAHYRLHKGSTIWSCILYLAPGDYHRYHCPVDFLAKSRNHILGSLAPVKESYISRVQGVYEGNERVVLQGEWSQGFMVITFVGAMNVGSMTVNFDKDLNTNECFSYPFDTCKTKSYDQDQFPDEVSSPYIKQKNGVQIPKGAEIGKFNMGSTVVLVFESKNPIQWKVKAGEKVRYGQPLFQVEEIVPQSEII